MTHEEVAEHLLAISRHLDPGDEHQFIEDLKIAILKSTIYFHGFDAYKYKVTRVAGVMEMWSRAVAVREEAKKPS